MHRQKLTPIASLFLALTIIFMPIPTRAMATANLSAADNPKALSDQYEAVQLRSDQSAKVFVALQFWTHDIDPPLQELSFTIPRNAVQDVTVFHGYRHITYCDSVGKNCNHVAEDLKDVPAEVAGTSDSTYYEKLSAHQSGQSYRVVLEHPIRPGGIGSFIISYQLPHVLKRKKGSYDHQFLKTEFEPNHVVAVGFLPDSGINLSTPKNPAYQPIPLSLQKALREQSKALSKAGIAQPASTYADLDLVIKQADAAKDDEEKSSFLDGLEGSIKGASQQAEFAMTGQPATATYSRGKLSLWSRIQNYFQGRAQNKKAVTEEKQQNLVSQEKAIISLFNSEVPEALEYYHTIYGSYPKNLEEMKRSAILPLVSLDPKAYLSNSGFINYAENYQKRLGDRGFKDPLTYEQLNEGKDYRLCLKNKIKNQPGCFSRADRPNFSEQMGQTAQDQAGKDFDKLADAIHSRDAIRETSINMITVNLEKYFSQHKRYPNQLDELTTDSPQLMRPDVTNDPLTKQSHQYKVLSGGQDFELCLNGEKYPSGDMSLTRHCFHKPETTK